MGKVKRMKTDLSESQVARYQDEGFLYYPALLDAEEVASIRAAVLEAVEAMGERKVALQDCEIGKSNEFYGRVFTQKLNLWRLSEPIRSLFTSPAMGSMLSQLAGVPSFRIWHDQALIKEPYANHTALHADNPFWSFHSRDALSIWIALDDATLANGCMCFLPRSHRSVTFQTTPIGENFGDVFRPYPALAETAAIPVEMKAGDCSFHNGLTIHGAGVNMTNARRAALTCAFMPDGSRFNGNKNILPDDYAQSLSPGDRLNDDAINPKVGW